MEEKFDFPLHVQHSLLSLAINDEEIIKYLAKIVQPSHFYSEEAQLVCKILQEFYTKYNCAPCDHFADIAETYIFNLPEASQELLIEFLHKIVSYSANKRYVLDHLSHFIDQAELTNVFLKGASLLQRGEVDKTKQLLSELKKGLFANPLTDAISVRDDKHKRPNFKEEILMGTGVEALDKVVRGFRRRNLVVWLAPPNVGKTWSLIQCAKTALYQGLKVLFYTLELEPEWIATRIDMSLTSLGLEEKTITLPDGTLYKVKLLSENEDERSKALASIGGEGGEIVISGTPYKGLSISIIESHLEQLSHKYFNPDVVIIDYADLMTPESHYTEWRHQLADMYKALRQMAVELRKHRSPRSSNTPSEASMRIRR